MNWNLADAEGRLSEVLNLAATEGPRTIRRRDEDFVVIAKADYDKLGGGRPTFKEWLLNGPAFDGLNLDRDRTPVREVEL